MFSDTSLEQALRECQDILEESEPITKHSWERRMHNLSENWDTVDVGRNFLKKC